MSKIQISASAGDAADLERKEVTEPRWVRLLSRHGSGMVAAALRLGGGLMQVLSAIVVTRIASPTQAGYFFIGFAGITLVAVLCRAGFDQAMTRVVSADFALGRSDAAGETIEALIVRFLRRALVVCPLLIAAALGVMYLPISDADASLVVALLPFVLGVPFLGVASLTGIALQAAGRPLLSVLTMFFIHNVCLMAAAFIPEAARDVGAFNYAFLLGCILAALFGSVALGLTLRSRIATHNGGTAPDPAERKREVQALVQENAWTVIGNLVLVWGPLSLLGLLSTPLEAARFGIAARSAQLVSFALPALNFVLAPRFSVLHATSQGAELRQILLRSSLLSLALSSVVAIPMMAFATPIMTFFGAGYASGAMLLVLLAAAQWANGASGATIQFLAMTGSEISLRRIFVLTAGLSLALGTPLVAWLGSTGAAQLTLGSALLLNLLCTVSALRAIRKASARAPAAASPTGLRSGTEHGSIASVA